MKTKAINLLLAIFLVALSNCTTPTKDSSVLTLDINKFEEIDEINYNDTTFFKKCFLVKLETSDQSLIGNIAQLEVSSTHIYIHDNKTSRLLMFDISGKYIRDIGLQGEAGNGEYLAINSFYITPDEEFINIVDPLKQVVHQYKQNGEFVQQIKPEQHVLSFSHKYLFGDGDKSIVSFGESNWEHNNYYKVIDGENLSLKQTLVNYPFKVEDYTTYSFAKQPFCLFNEEVIMSKLFTDTIFSYKDGTVSPHLIVKNHENIENKELLNRFVTENGNYTKVLANIAREGKYNAGIMNVFENNNFFFCDFWDKNFLAQGIIWDKQKEKGFRLTEYSNVTPNLNNIEAISGNTVVRQWTNDQVLFFKENILKEKSGYPEDILLAVENYNEEDNSLLLFFEFK